VKNERKRKRLPKSDEIHNMLVTDELKQPRICGRCKVEGGNGGNPLTLRDILDFAQN
jgi:hypothetical protein